jgi:hypothetical protein
MHGEATPTMSDYQSKFHSITDLVQGAAQSVMSKIDHFTFKMLVNCLKNEDFESANTAIEQLTKEKRPLSIPPLYYVWQAHPSKRIRDRAEKALDIIGDKAEIKSLTEGKNIEDAVRALIEHYGNFKQG